jgi:alanine racemase
MAMVKANAYGHGLIETSTILASLGIDCFGVAFSSEAVLLRQAGITLPIIMMTPPEDEDIYAIIKYSIETVICTEHHLRELSKQAKEKNALIKVHTYIDTGMHRDGFDPSHTLKFIELLHSFSNLQWAGICTHLATSDSSDTSFMDKQLSIFYQCIEQLKQEGYTIPRIHLSNSAGMVRLGLSLYGYNVIGDIEVPNVLPVMSIESRVLSLRRIKKGESVSYGRSFIADTDTTIATIPIGYGDGLFRHLSNKISFIINGKFYPVIGNICMDECMVNIGDDPCSVSDRVVIIGSQGECSQDAKDIANIIHTIPYEITTAISNRVPRRIE